MNNKRRLDFLCWLHYKVFKTPEGVSSNKFVQGIKHILFPTEFIYNNQFNLRWDLFSNNYYICGYKVTAKDLMVFLKEKGELVNGKK